MIRAHRVAATAQDDASLISDWNIAPNLPYTVNLLPGTTSCGVLLWSEDGVLVATGAALVGTEQPCVLIPQAGQDIDMVDAELGWHLLLTTTGTESQRTIRIGPTVDLPDEIHPAYADDDMALARATAAIDEAAHYRDDVTVTCPLGLGAVLGDVVSVPVDGMAVVGQVESITWTATPDGIPEQYLVRRHVAIAPEAYVHPVPVVPPVVVDDTGTTDAATITSGNVLTNDEAGLTVVAVNGLAASVGAAVDGSNGGSFSIAADGSWTFDPDGDFTALEGTETATTSVTYYASDGVSEAMATLTVTVSATGVEPDPLWADVAMLIQAPESGSVIADAKGNTVTAQGNVEISNALDYPTIYFDGSGDRLDVGAVGDFNFLHNGSNWSIEFLIKPESIVNGDVILDTARGTTANIGLYIGFTSGKLWVFITRGVASSYVLNVTLNHVFSSGEEKTVCLEYDHTLSAGTVKLYVDGVLVATGNKTSNPPSTANHQQMMVGMFSSASVNAAYHGHARFMRITHGVRYGEAHTTPAWPLPTA